MTEQRISVSPEAAGHNILPPIPGDLLIPTENYARVEFAKAFGNFSILLPRLRKGAYAAVFYSLKKPNLSKTILDTHEIADDLSYLAASQMGGLITYVKGRLLPPSKNRNIQRANGLDYDPNCMSFCIWVSEEQARRAAESIPHLIATKIASKVYDRYTIRTFDVRTEVSLEDGVEDIIFQPRQG